MVPIHLIVLLALWIRHPEKASQAQWLTASQAPSLATGDKSLGTWEFYFTLFLINNLLWTDIRDEISLSLSSCTFPDVYTIIRDGSWFNYLKLQWKPKSKHSTILTPICHCFILPFMYFSWRKLNHKSLAGNKAERRDILSHGQSPRWTTSTYFIILDVLKWFSDSKDVLI